MYLCRLRFKTSGNSVADWLMLTAYTSLQRALQTGHLSRCKLSLKIWRSIAQASSATCVLLLVLSPNPKIRCNEGSCETFLTESVRLINGSSTPCRIAVSTRPFRLLHMTQFDFYGHWRQQISLAMACLNPLPFKMRDDTLL